MTITTGRKLGALVGVALAGGLLPGITLGPGSDAYMSVLFAFIAVAVLTQLIYIGPSAHVGGLPLLALAAAGVVQDSLIWWLLSWAGPASGSDLRVDGFLTIVLAGLITRIAILGVSLLLGRPADEED
ncbi:hypothetical protein ACGFMM_22020 [Streptomyces sp. NPDC048604]|uniref:hypothetical protein n=1 Tax=Streptomyces sp. NPDC048604 TaxID=3365578 RepID=UPI003714DA2F